MTLRMLDNIDADQWPGVAMTDLPWMRRERLDADLRSAGRELEGLIGSDPGYAEWYGVAGEVVESMLRVLDAIEAREPHAFSVRVRVHEVTP